MRGRAARGRADRGAGKHSARHDARATTDGSHQRRVAVVALKGDIVGVTEFLASAGAPSAQICADDVDGCDRRDSLELRFHVAVAAVPPHDGS